MTSTEIKPAVSYTEDGDTGKYTRPHLGKFEEMFAGVEAPPPMTEERLVIEKKLKRKIDMTILPCVLFMYILNYLDRNNIAAAKLGGMMEDLGLTASQFSTCQILLFAGYIPATIPSNILLEKVGRPRFFISGAMLLWGVLSACVTKVNSFAGLCVLRVFIGVFEATFYPGVIFYLSCWYTRREIGVRAAIYVAGSWLSGAFSGLIAEGVLNNLDGVRGLEAWRWLFLIEGVATVAFSFFCMLILPELPATTRWLSPEERLVGVLRMVEDIGTTDEDVLVESGEKQGPLAGVILVLKDPKAYMFVALVFFIASAAGINAVFPTIVNSLGYSYSTTLYLTVPPWVLVAFTSLINSWHSDRVGERFWHCMIGPCISFIGFIIGISTLKFGARYTCMLLMLQMYTSWSLFFSWGVNNMPRPPIKRAAAVAIMNIGANIPNLYVPYLFNANGAAPHFYAGFGFCIAMLLCAISVMVGIRIVLAIQNKKLNNGETVDGMSPESGFRFLY